MTSIFNRCQENIIKIVISYTSVYRAAQPEVEVQPTLQPQPTTPQVVVLPVQQQLWRATIIQPHQHLEPQV